MAELGSLGDNLERPTESASVEGTREPLILPCLPQSIDPNGPNGPNDPVADQRGSVLRVRFEMKKCPRMPNRVKIPNPRMEFTWWLHPRYCTIVHTVHSTALRLTVLSTTSLVSCPSSLGSEFPCRARLSHPQRLQGHDDLGQW